jgi:hypothetical protein
MRWNTKGHWVARDDAAEEVDDAQLIRAAARHGAAAEQHLGVGAPLGSSHRIGATWAVATTAATADSPLLFGTNCPGSQAAFGLHHRNAVDAGLIHGELVTPVACATDRILVFTASGTASSS